MKLFIRFFCFLDKFSIHLFKFWVLVSPFINFCWFKVKFKGTHLSSESFLPSWIKINFLGNWIWDNSKIEKDHNQVWLLTDNRCTLFSKIFTIFGQICFLFWINFNKLFSFSDLCSNVVEKIRIPWVCKNLIPRCSLTWFFWDFNRFQLCDCIWIVN